MVRSKSIQKEFWLISSLILFGALIHFWGSRETLDAKFYYSSAEAKFFFQNLNQDEIRSYLRNELFDIGFIFIYSALFFTLFKRHCPVYSRFSFFALMPGAFDLLETITIIAVLIGILEEPPAWLGVATCLKWATGAIFIIFSTFHSIKQFRFRKPFNNSSL